MLLYVCVLDNSDCVIRLLLHFDNIVLTSYTNFVSYEQLDVKANVFKHFVIGSHKLLSWLTSILSRNPVLHTITGKVLFQA